MQNTELKILPELQTLLPCLTEVEFAGLEESMLKDGCLSPLAVWNDILIDGHHRYALCRKHQIPFALTNVVFDSLDDAKLWIWKHQENRRNLTSFQRAEIALKLKDSLAAKAKERQVRKPANFVPQILAEQKETRKELAEVAQISHTTLEKAEYIAEHADEDTKEKLRKGKKGTSINKEYKRLKEQNTAKEKPVVSASGKKTTKKAQQAEPFVLPSRKKLKDKFCCGVEFKPDPGDTFYDWITDEERNAFQKIQKQCPSPIFPQIRNITIQNIPEHKAEPLVDCLFSLFSPLYRKKLAFALLREMFQELEERESALSVVETLQQEFTCR